jgi:DNA repair protein RadD
VYALRTYQTAAVDSIFEYFGAKDGHPLVVLPTGAGKSIVLAEFIRRTIEQWPSERFLVLTHVKELIAQNSSKLRAIAPNLDIGIYSAGLGKKHIGKHVTVAGIQSVHQKAHHMGDVSIVIIDEAHLLSKNASSMYGNFLTQLRALCPRFRLVGMTATPFRMDSGPLHKGSKALFTDIAYNISMLELIKQGYLAEIVSKPTGIRADVSKVAKRGGEYIAGELEQAMDQAHVTNPALDKVEELCADRKSWLVFCVGIDHAQHVTQALRERGHKAEMVIGDTPKAQRDLHIMDFKDGKIRALVSVGVLTTGFDAPNADALICLRPTMSPGLWVQMCGRVSRTSPGKVNGLVLDFTANTRTHGPVDLIDIDNDGEVQKPITSDCPQCKQVLILKRGNRCDNCGFVFTKPCAACGNPVPLGVKECATCGYVAETIAREAKHNQKPTEAPMLSSHVMPEVEKVDGWEFKIHRKEGKPPSVKVEYFAGLMTYNEWVCFEHGGYASEKAARWWRRRGGDDVPETSEEAIARVAELKPPDSIIVKRAGKYWEVIG